MTKSSQPEPPHLFAGPDAAERAENVIRDGRVFRGLSSAIPAIVRAGKIQTLSAGTPLGKQGDVADDVFFVLSGDVDILVNGQIVAQRGPGELVGEMALLEPSPKRSTTMVTRGPTCVLRLYGSEFVRQAEQEPMVWKGVAREIAARLRQRTSFVPKANERPSMFIGSSVEKLAVVDPVLLGLRYDDLELHPWTNSFRPSRYTVDDLVAELSVCDFATFVFAPDDRTQSRGKIKPAVRDNVVFEVGLFMGILGRERVFLLRPRRQDLNLPSDLTGLKTVDYTIENDKPNVAAACAEIREAVRTLGCRQLRQVFGNP